MAWQGRRRHARASGPTTRLGRPNRSGRPDAEPYAALRRRLARGLAGGASSAEGSFGEISVSVLWLTDTAVTVRLLPIRVLPSLATQGFFDHRPQARRRSPLRSPRCELGRSVLAPQRAAEEGGLDV